MPKNDEGRKKELREAGAVGGKGWVQGAGGKGWDRGAWFEAYPEGISAFRAKDKWELLKLFSRYHADVLPVEEYDMQAKIKGWVGGEIDSHHEKNEAAGVEAAAAGSESSGSESSGEEEEDEEE
ncbi:MAG: hypothetical protein Q9195_004680 [Heterodermia aff. obscurata]